MVTGFFFLIAQLNLIFEKNNEDLNATNFCFATWIQIKKKCLPLYCLHGINASLTFFKTENKKESFPF